MSDMSASVVLRLVDDLTRPARSAGNAVRGLTRDIERLNRLSGNASRASRGFEHLTKEVSKAHQAATGLHRTLSRPVSNGFGRATTGINNVTSAANRAANAVTNLNRRLRGGSGYGGNALPATRTSNHGGRSGRHGGSLWGGAARHVGSAALHVGVYEAAVHGAEMITEGFKTGMEQAFERQHTVAMLKMQGESPQAIQAALAQSRSMANLIPNYTSAQHLEAIAELRPALLGGLDEATKLAPMFQQATAVLEAVKQGAGKKALSGVETRGEALDMVRALEIGGLTTHKGWSEDKIEANMLKYVDGMTKAVVGMNGQIGAKDFHSAFKFSRGDSVNWTPEFATEILPTLMNEMKKGKFGDASQVGNALKSMSRVVMDGVMKPELIGKWNQLGMFAPGAMTKGKHGLGRNPKFNGGVMIGADMWQSNPFEWVQQYLLPHLQQHGVDLGNRKSVVAALGGLFGNRVANHLAQILAIQQDQIRKDQENIKKAQGVGGLNFLMNADPTTRMHVFSAAMKDMLGAIGDLAMPGVMRGMKGLIDWSHRMADSINSSAYMKTLGDHFDSFVAGLFGQKMGRTGMAGKDGYYGAGEYIGGAWSRMMSAIGKTMVFWERSGVASFVTTNAIRSLGVACDAIAGTINGVRDVMQKFSDSDFFKSITKTGADIAQTIKDALAPSKPDGPTYADAIKTAAQAAPTNADILKTLAPISSLGPSVAPKLPPMVRQGSDLARSMSPTMNTLASGMDFAPKVMQPITQAIDSATPMLARGGETAMAAFASGLASGGGQVTSEMSTLLGTLASIAAAGVTIPVKLDAAGAEADIKAMMLKATAGAQKRASAQFSNALSDIG